MNKIKSESAATRTGARGNVNLPITASSIFKSGNSLAFRIPSVIAKQLNFEEGSPVEIEVDDGRLVVRRKSKIPPLDELLAKITPENLHGEEFGDLLVSERW